MTPVYARIMFLIVAIAVWALFLSCSSNDNTMNSGGGGGTPTGILLSGADADSALKGTSNHGPFVIPETEMIGTFATTRLEAVINPGATVGAANSALTAVGAKISGMHISLPLVELIIDPPLTDTSHARVVCSTLVASGAFLFAFPVFLDKEADEIATIPANPARKYADFLFKQGFPAAWNAASAVGPGSPIKVIVLDAFGSFTSHPEIPSLTFPPRNGRATTTSVNHGFSVAGVIGATHDSLASTGIFPGPASRLAIEGYPHEGLSWAGTLLELQLRFPATGDFLVNTSFGYGDVNFVTYPKPTRILHALSWRALVTTEQFRFLHASSAGNDGITSTDSGNAFFRSPFTLAASYDDPISMLSGTNVSSSDTSSLVAFYNAIKNVNIINATKLTNTFVVGASDTSGSEATFSNRPTAIRMIGREIYAPCMTAGGTCVQNSENVLQAKTAGTSFSTPSIIGLAAYMMSIYPGISVSFINQALTNSYNGKWVDAYRALLQTDPTSIANAKVRKALLDVEGNDGDFDELDIKEYLKQIEDFEDARQTATPPLMKDYSRFDLNGDGFTGDTGGVRTVDSFDLNINFPPQYTTAVALLCESNSTNDSTFNEKELTDEDILMYYAYSDLYSGVDSVRDSIYGVDCSPFWVSTPKTEMYIYNGVTGFPAFYDTISSTSYHNVIDEMIDSLSPLCKTGYSVHSEVTADGQINAIGSASGITIDASVNILNEAAASSASNPSPCEFGVAQSVWMVHTVRFVLSGDQNVVPFTLAIGGDANPKNNSSPQPIGRLIVELYITDTLQFPNGATPERNPQFLTFDSDLNTFPFQTNSALTPLAAHHVYELRITGYSITTAITQRITSAASSVGASVSLVAQ